MSNFDMRKQPARDQYQGCGWAWVAMNENDQIIAVRYMNRAPYFVASSPEALARAKRKRRCPASQRAADDLNAESFAKYRLECRRELSEMGTLVSGMMSGCHFFPKRKDQNRVQEWPQMQLKEYTCYGTVRGGCGHKHLSIQNARNCTYSDQYSCNSIRLSEKFISDRRVLPIDSEELPSWYRDQLEGRRHLQGWAWQIVTEQ